MSRLGCWYLAVLLVATGFALHYVTITNQSLRIAYDLRALEKEIQKVEDHLDILTARHHELSRHHLSPEALLVRGYAIDQEATLSMVAVERNQAADD